MECNKIIHADKERLEKNLKRLSQIGRNQKGGIDRVFGSSTDIEARNWISSLWEKELGSEVTTDAAANLWAHISGTKNLAPIVIGSHHDAVKNGGMYDGALGVMLATEVMQRIKEEGIKLRHPFSIVSFSAEEPNPFNVSTLGSKIVSGKLTKEQLSIIKDESTNVSLKSTLESLGGNLENLDQAVIKYGDIGAFIECHIEQGRNLYDQGISLGAVTEITGIYREKIRILGEANHAGTTLMKYRHDAILTASEICIMLEKAIVDINRNDLVGTVGYISASPNSANIIAGEASLILEIRSTKPKIVKEVLNNLKPKFDEVMNRRKVQIVREIILNQLEVPMDETVRGALISAARAINEPIIELPSMAGHDAAHIAKVAKTGMLFVPSIKGKSHCPDEDTYIGDIEKAANALIQAVLILDKELN